MSYNKKPKTSRPFEAKWDSKGKTCHKCNQGWRAKTMLMYEDDQIVHVVCPTRRSNGGGKTVQQMFSAPARSSGINVPLEITEEGEGVLEEIAKKIFVPSRFQQAIFDWIVEGVGNAVVEAVAGSGKTTTIVKALELIPSHYRILFLAFNKHIVKELKRRVPKHITVRTVHGLGRSIIAKLEDFKDLDNDKVSNIMNEFWPISRKQLEDMTAEALWEAFGISRAEISGFVSRNRIKRNCMRKVISLAKATMVDFYSEEEVLKMIDRYNIEIDEQDETEIIERLPEVMEKNNANLEFIDFDDMPYLPLVNERLKNHFDKFDFILVDEAQDLNASNIQLIMNCIAEGGRVIAVGDRHQSLYGFRGADTEAIPRLIEMLDAQTLPLSISYRCPRKHVENVQELVPHIEAAENAIEGILGEIKYEDLVDEVQAGDMVLCRTNAPLVKPAFETIARGTKAIIRGANIGEEMINFIERFQTDDLAHLEIMMAEYVQIETERLLSKNKDMQAENLRDKLDTIMQIAHECKTVGDLIKYLEMLFSDDNVGVVYSSVHRAKGLESQRVFILHPELMPHPKAKQDWEQVQERNGMYVARTRSLNEMYVVLGKE